MVWHKAWIDTRWRFLLALTLLLVSACTTVMAFRTVQGLAASLSPGAMLGNEALQQELSESLEMVRTFRGYAWSQWFAQGLTGPPGLLTLFAALLGSGSPLLKSGSGALFSLALPVSRGRWVGTRAATGLVELFVLALAASATFAAAAPLVGEQFSFVEAVVYGLCGFVVASLFFGFAVFFSTVFNDVWRPLLLTCLAAVVFAAVETSLPEGFGLFQAMAGKDYFYGGSLPWAVLVLSAAAAVGLLHAAAANIARRDF
jgi:ABC-2 type transport system permease protein